MSRGCLDECLRHARCFCAAAHAWGRCPQTPLFYLGASPQTPGIFLAKRSFVMEWREEGVLLSVRRHGEHAAIVEVFTAAHGLHAGVVRGGASRKMAPVLQPGAQLDLSWRARLADHLGAFGVEPVRSRAAQVMGDRQALAGLNAICGLLCFALAERDPHPELYAQTLDLFDRRLCLRRCAD